MMKQESDRKDRKCLNHAHAQLFDRCEAKESIPAAGQKDRGLGDGIDVLCTTFLKLCKRR